MLYNLHWKWNVLSHVGAQNLLRMQRTVAVVVVVVVGVKGIGGQDAQGEKWG